MKRPDRGNPRILMLSLLGLFLLLIPCSSHPFGFHAHRLINRMAVFTLPPEMLPLYKHHVEFISERSIDPDRRAHAVAGEAPRHYIDIDHFGEDPFAIMPRHWDDAVDMFTEDTLMQYGVLPWHIDRMMHRLTRAFRTGDIDQILLVSAHLGHYVADASTPLHTTRYYNGKTASQRGIHALWESRLPELYANRYDFFTGRAEYIHDPLAMAWHLIALSHAQVEPIYRVFDSLLHHVPRDRVYAHEMRGASTGRVFSRDFSHAFHESLNGMVEQQMRLAVKTIGDFWFTAWVNAGQPDLSPIETQRLTRGFLESLKKERDNWDAAPGLPDRNKSD